MAGDFQSAARRLAEVKTQIASVSPRPEQPLDPHWKRSRWTF